MDHGSNSNRSSTGRDGKKLDIKDGNVLLSLLNLQSDKLCCLSHDYRPVRHRKNTPFYAECITQKLSYCRQLRRGHPQQGGIRLNCDEHLTAIAKYNPWYPEFVRLQPSEEPCTLELCTQYKQIFEKCGTIWDDEKGNMLLEVWESDSYLRDPLAIVAEQMNARYFHGYPTNIEGWYDPQALAREHVIETFKHVCDGILRHTITNDPNGAPKIVNMSMQTIIQDTPRPIADLNAVPIETITSIEYVNLGCNKCTLQHDSIYANSLSDGATNGADAASTHSGRNQHSTHPNGNNDDAHCHVAQNSGYHTIHLQHNE